jgi:hypothetical protein
MYFRTGLNIGIRYFGGRIGRSSSGAVIKAMANIINPFVSSWFSGDFAVYVGFPVAERPSKTCRKTYLTDLVA